MMKLNGCRRCKGDLVIEKDVYGWYEECVQCGYTHDIAVERIPVPVLATEQAQVLTAFGLRR